MSQDRGASAVRSARTPQRRARVSRRDLILHEAMECFAAYGFRGTTTREVAARVGISEAGLYRHFPSKEALYSAIIDAKIAAPALVDELAAVAARGDDRGVFRGLAHGILERSLRDPAFLRILYFTALEQHALAEPFFATRVRGLREFLSDYLERRVREGALRPLDPVLMARAFLGMVMDHLNVVLVFRQEDVYAQPIDAVVETFVEVFLGGVQLRSASAEAPRGTAAEERRS
jgi:AcrR family transcriptional regulator